jgi:predicted AlkP superfamily pyrophosphatase or phosphodiesterase
MKPVLVIDVAGLTPFLVGLAPNLKRFADKGGLRPMRPMLPALAGPVQASLLTGLPPSGHGIVADGWYLRDAARIRFRPCSGQSMEGERIWDAARRLEPGFTAASLFWRHGIESGADVVLAPPAAFPEDGRGVPAILAEPSSLEVELSNALGRFPAYGHEGPEAGLRSCVWIARATQHVLATRRPTLTLVRLGHLGRCLERHGPGSPEALQGLAEVDALCGELMEDAEAEGAGVMVLSEYGVRPVSRPIHVNRALRQAGLFAIRREGEWELPDLVASAAFAVADHQVAHIHVRRTDLLGEVERLLRSLPGVERVLGAREKRLNGLDHRRSGDLVALAAPDAWFTYYHWLDDGRAPPWARRAATLEKTGADPVELFSGPAPVLPGLVRNWRVWRRRLGLRLPMEIVPLDAGLVRGSYGRPSPREEEGPVLIGNPALMPAGPVDATAVKSIILAHLCADADMAGNGHVGIA